MNRSVNRWLLCSVASVSFAYAVGAHAQAVAPPAREEAHGVGLEEVVVTARRVEENVQDTPISMTALTNNTLEQRRVVSIESLGKLAPNLVVTQSLGFVGAIAPFIRGQGQSEVQFGQDSPIGLYIDGVYMGRTNNARFDLVELERVEVLRGPQGTLFGRNTAGGAISLVTRLPKDEFGGEFKGSGGNYSALAGRLRLDTGLIGDSGIKATLAYQHRQNNGYVDNTLVDGNGDPGASKSDAVWAKAVGQWGKFSATLSADYSDVRAYPLYIQGIAASQTLTDFLNAARTLNGKIYQPSPNYISSTSNSAPGILEQVKTHGFGLTLVYDFNDSLTVKSITASRGYTFGGGGATGPNGLVGLFGNTLATATVQTAPSLNSPTARFESQSQSSQELQLLGTLGEFHYVAGAYYFVERARNRATAQTVLARPGGFALLSISPTAYWVRNVSTGAFGQVTWKPGFADDKLEVAAGARYTEDSKVAKQMLPTARNGSTNPTDTSVLGSVTYQWTPDVMFYARYATGYRSGGFNTRATGTAPFVYLPEKTKSYEVGFKVEAFDRRFRLNGAVFKSETSNLQVAQFAITGSNQLNADARFTGFELEAVARPVESLTLNASLGYVDAKYEHLFLAAPVTNVITNFASIGNFNYVPKQNISVGFTYEFPRASYGQWSVLGNYYYQSRVAYALTSLPNLSPFGDLVGGSAYGILSGRVNLSDIRIANHDAQISLFGENLTNEHYVVSGVDYGAAVGFAAQVYGLPRTFGVEVKVDF